MTAPNAPTPTLVSKVGLATLCLAIALAPAIGGYPPGAEYGADTALNALRAFVFVAGLCLGLSPYPAEGNAAPGKLAAFARYAAWGMAGVSALSLLVHSRFLTSPVYLFAMLPAALDFLCYALVFALCLHLGRNRSAAHFLVYSLAAGAAWCAIASAREYGQFAQSGMRGQRVGGAFFSPNFAAGFFALLLPPLVAGCVAAKERLGAVVLGAIASLCTGGLVATGSRAGIAIAALGLFAAFGLAVFSTRGRLPWARVAGLLAAFALLGFAFRGPLTSRVETGGGQEHSGAFRTWTWKGAAQMAKANPFLGTGPGTFTYKYPRYALVARTDLAHSSYLQTATEQGFIALALAAGAALLAFGAGVVFLVRRPSSRGHTAPSPANTPDDTAFRLLLCGLGGGLLAGIARSAFDSEWSLLGNAFPFWAVAGLCASGLGVLSPAPPAAPSQTGKTKTAYAALVLPLLASVLLLRAVGPRDAAQALRREGRLESRPVQDWPPDPTVAFLNDKPDEAARIEPSGKRLYQLARAFERTGDLEQAVTVMRQAAEADPNSTQTWYRLAQMQEQAGQTSDALASWQQMVRLHQSPVGQIRAIPELPETYPAWAYAALARDANSAGDTQKAAEWYEKAAGIVEQYSQTTPLYQQMEVFSAQATGGDVAQRRSDVRALYEQVMDELTRLNPARKGALTARRDAALSRLDAFVKPETQTLP